ncbi:heterokaryon incompatibility protein-domain-containing protein [Phialemonium atrogriseum]|uniref:Heterokaryon incompatibility protein-domain-containing protein n=1 Tax=Phialemonium atrogriseum TaxID=1093897 RepID=A0AAJ0C6F8_9PEZI|nr:heterokaryon incompatibility protein-domain-containing protein [Phialemonium atrogriseum]KAK1770836.1 heterokaryon incompatibility protein-domain-containing protein [Phialemonium atrogriseum]
MTEVHAALPPQPYPGPVLPTSDHVRLLVLLPGDGEHITGELMIAELQAMPCYEALSYTWGDSRDRRMISIKATTSGGVVEFPVTLNCFSALRRLRLKDKPRTLWIDALCIDQSNRCERNHQVTLMSKIFSKAAEVVIYLGEAAEDSDLAMDFIAECDSPSPETTSLSYPKSPSLVKALDDFFHRLWFTRVWVIQEVVLSSSGVAYCGERSLPWSSIRNFNDWNHNNKWLTSKLPFVVSTSKRSLTNGDLESAMLKALLQARHCGATDPRDKVYAMLPLMHSFDRQLGITPRYGDSVAKVFVDCAIALIPDRGFEILYAAQGGSKIEGLPSWVPDWSVAPRRKTLGTSQITSVWNAKKDWNISRTPQVFISAGRTSSSNTTDAEPGPLLRIFGYSCGKITRLGAPYIASQGRFPLHEWKSLIPDKSESKLDGIENSLIKQRNGLSYKSFYEVIAARGFAYPSAIQKFVGAESNADTDTESGAGPSESEASGGRGFTLGQKRKRMDNWDDKKPKTSWGSTVREMARERGCEVPFADIPFHLAGKYLVASYGAYVRFVLQNCHSRRFIITDTGYMGIAPEEADLGDEIYMCVGAAIPLALRRQQRSSGSQDRQQSRATLHRLVGECYMEKSAWGDIEDMLKSREPQGLDIM